MSLKNYAERIFLSTQGIPDFYSSFLKGSEPQLEQIAKYLKGYLIDME